MGDQARMNRLGQIAREGLPDDIDPARDAAGRERLVAAVTRGGGRTGPLGAVLRGERARWVGALAAAAALAAGAAVLWPPPRLGCVVESAGAGAAECGYVRAPDGAEARVRFTDGSAVALEGGASMRVAEVTAHGARVVLEDGRAALKVAHLPGARWSVEAGPFAVLVTGTEFHVDWSRADETLRVDLIDGAVTVRGPMAPDGLPLRAGQRLVARQREGDVQIVGIEAADAALRGVEAPAASAAEDAAASEASSEASAAAAPGEAGAAGRPQAEAGARSWSKRVAAGDFKGVLSEAEQRGLDAVFAHASLDDLTALGDAARYARRGDVARGALEATRKRFPGSSAGRAAAFLLGRLADGGAPGAAIVWYDTYLAESPGGPFAAEALGRKMLAVQRTSGRAAARAVAEQYLRRHPTGAHAPLARDLVNP